MTIVACWPALTACSCTFRASKKYPVAFVGPLLNSPVVTLLMSQEPPMWPLLTRMCIFYVSATASSK